MPNAFAALDDILSLAVPDRAPRDRIQIVGTDPVLATNAFLGTAGAAAVAATAFGATSIWELRTGRQQSAWVDVRHAAMAMRSDRLIRCDGEKTSVWGPISGFYETGDARWVQLHCNFPHHRDGVLRILGCDNDRDAVAAALAKREALAVEEACSDAGLCVAAIRSPEEWNAHPQAAAIDSLPLYEIDRIGDAPPRPFAPAERPLSDVRVLDLTRVIAGPICGRTLAEHGADVLRISAPHLPFVEALLMDTGNGKRNAEIDLRQEDGRKAFDNLLAETDVFNQSFRPGALDRFGCATADLAERKPGIVCVSLSAYGRLGPWAEKRGFDSLVQCCSGLVHTQSAGLDGPHHLPAQVLDYATGYIAAYGAMEALRRRSLEGGSWHVRVSLAQTAHWIRRLGVFGAKEDARDLPDPGPEDVPDFMMETPSPFGLIRHLAPVAVLSETPGFWPSPPMPLGAHPPEWA